MKLKKWKVNIHDIPIWIQIRRGKFIASVWDPKYFGLFNIKNESKKVDGYYTVFYMNETYKKDITWDIDDPIGTSSIGLGIKPPSALYKNAERDSECFQGSIEDKFLVNELINIISKEDYKPIKFIKHI